jgi:hypothetical protein
MRGWKAVLHQQSSDQVTTIDLDIAKNTFRPVVLDKRDAIVAMVLARRGWQGWMMWKASG